MHRSRNIYPAKGFSISSNEHYHGHGEMCRSIIDPNSEDLAFDRWPLGLALSNLYNLRCLFK